MINIKACLFFLLWVSLTASLDKDYEQRVAELRNLLELSEDDLQELGQDRRHNQDEIQKSRNAIDSDRQPFLRNMKDEIDEDENQDDLGLRTTSNSQHNNAGIVVTLQNRAAMNTRLRVLYTDPACQPYLAETNTLVTHETGSVVIPSNSQNIKVTVQKDMIASNWRDIKTVPM
ncbi:unnamed protein product, partial [Rotaria sordida]